MNDKNAYKKLLSDVFGIEKRGNRFKCAECGEMIVYERGRNNAAPPRYCPTCEYAGGVFEVVE